MASRRRSGFKIVPHTSEVALELRGGDWPGFYEAAARGLSALYGAAPGARPEERRRVELVSESAEGLLVAWLNELIYIVGTRRWLHAEARCLEADDRHLVAELLGAPLGSGKLEREIKAATFGALAVKPARGGGWKTTVILDV